MLGNRRIQAAAMIAFLMLVHSWVTIAWLRADHFNMGQIPDGLMHTQGIIRLHGGLRLGGAAAVRAALRDRSSNYPLLGHLPAALAALALGPTPTAFRLGSLLYLAILLIAVYGLGRRCHSHSAGLLAAVLVALMPGVYGGLRTVGLDLAALSLTAVAFYCLVRADGFRDLRFSALYGLAAAVAILAKGQSAFFLLAPSAFELGRQLLAQRQRPSASAGPQPSILDRRPELRPLVGAGLALGLVVGCTAVWWGGRLGILLGVLGSHVSGEGMLYFEDDPSLWGGIRVYAAAFPLLITGLLTAALLPLSLRFFGHARRHRWLVLVWIAVPVVLHILLKVRHHRYLMPLVPALVLVIAVGICTLKPRLLRAAAALLLTAGAGASWLICSFGAAPYHVEGITPHRSLPALQGSSSLLSQLFTCGDVRYVGPPNPQPVVTPFMGSGRRVARWIARRHPGGGGALLSCRGAQDLFHAAFEVQQALPELLLVRGRAPDSGRTIYHLNTKPDRPPAPDVRRVLSYPIRDTHLRVTLWAPRRGSR